MTDGIAMSVPEANAHYGSVKVSDKEGNIYELPNMNITELVRVLPTEDGRVPSSMPSLVMVNISFAVLSIPFMIIKNVIVGDEVLWHD